MSNANTVVKQLAFELFQEAEKANLPITEIKQDIGLNRSNATISVKGNNLPLLGRRLVNAFYFVAHRDALEVEQHSAPLDYFKWLAGYDSTNHKYLKQTIRGVQQTLIDIQIENEDTDTTREQWASIPYINEVYFTGGKVYFTVPKSLRKQLQQPKSFTYLSLRISNAFTSEYAHNLYERCSAAHFQGCTPWWSIEEFRQITNTVELSSYDEFKTLKRKVIQPAIDQINELSDIFIELETRSITGSKKIGWLRFVIDKNIHGKLVLTKPLDEDTFQILREEFGLSPNEISDISQNYDYDYIRSKIDFTRHRIEQAEKKSTGRIEYPGRYFIKALKEDLTLPKATKVAVAEQATIQLQLEQSTQAVAEASQAKTDRVTEYLQSATADQLEALLDGFRKSQFFAPFRKRIGNDPIDLDENKAVRSAFHGYVAKTIPGLMD